MPKETLRNSWKWLGIATVCGLASYGVSEGAYELFGYDDDKPATTPIWLRVLIGFVGVLILLTPTFIAVEHAWKARKHKVKGAVIPLIIGATIFAYVIIEVDGSVFGIS